MGYIYAKTEEQKLRGRRLLRLAGRIALFGVLFGVLLVIVGIITSPKVLNIQILPEIVWRSLFIVVLFGLCFAGGLACIGAKTFREDYEARTYSGRTLVNPMSSGLSWLAFVLFALPFVPAGLVIKEIAKGCVNQKIDAVVVVNDTTSPGGKDSRYLEVTASGFKPHAHASIYGSFPTKSGRDENFSGFGEFDDEGKLDWKKTDIPLLKSVGNPDYSIEIRVESEGCSASKYIKEKEFMSPN